MTRFEFPAPDQFLSIVRDVREQVEAPSFGQLLALLEATCTPYKMQTGKRGGEFYYTPKCRRIYGKLKDRVGRARAVVAGDTTQADVEQAYTRLGSPPGTAEQVRALFGRDVHPDEFQAMFSAPPVKLGDMRISGYSGGQVYITGQHQVDGTSISTLSRTISRESDGSLKVYHGLFDINPAYQGSGIAGAVFSNAMAGYKKLGVRKLGVSAALQVGPLAWALFGFQASPSTLEGFKHQVAKDRIPKLFGPKFPKAKVAALVKRFQDSVQNMQDLANFKVRYKDKGTGKFTTVDVGRRFLLERRGSSVRNNAVNTWSGSLDMTNDRQRKRFEDQAAAGLRRFKATVKRGGVSALAASEADTDRRQAREQVALEAYDDAIEAGRRWQERQPAGSAAGTSRGSSAGAAASPAPASPVPAAAVSSPSVPTDDQTVAQVLAYGSPERIRTRDFVQASATREHGLSDSDARRVALAVMPLAVHTVSYTRPDTSDAEWGNALSELSASLSGIEPHVVAASVDRAVSSLLGTFAAEGLRASTLRRISTRAAAAQRVIQARAVATPAAGGGGATPRAVDSPVAPGGSSDSSSLQGNAAIHAMLSAEDADHLYNVLDPSVEGGPVRRGIEASRAQGRRFGLAEPEAQSLGLKATLAAARMLGSSGMNDADIAAQIRTMFDSLPSIPHNQKAIVLRHALDRLASDMIARMSARGGDAVNILTRNAMQILQQVSRAVAAGAGSARQAAPQAASVMRTSQLPRVEARVRFREALVEVKKAGPAGQAKTPKKPADDPAEDRMEKSTPGLAAEMDMVLTADVGSWGQGLSFDMDTESLYRDGEDADA